MINTYLINETEWIAIDGFIWKDGEWIAIELLPKLLYFEQ